jgi:hypothetical protein
MNAMTDWENLLVSAPDRSLDSLEADIHRVLNARRSDDRRSAVLLSTQAGLVILSVCCGLAWGGLAARHISVTPPLGVFSPEMVLAPSSRLVGTSS